MMNVRKTIYPLVGCLALGNKVFPNGKKCVVIHCVSYELGEFIIRAV